MNMFPTTNWIRPFLIFTLLSGLAFLAGCEAAGALLAPYERSKEVEIPAEYRGLNAHKIAVLVDAPMDIQFEYMAAAPGLSNLINMGIHQECDGSEIRTTASVISYQTNNVYWSSKDFEDVARDLGVDRIVLIDLVEYRLFSPGNSYIWDGLVIGDVSVFERDSFDPSTPVYAKRIMAQYPQQNSVSRDQATRQQIESGLQILFAQRTCRLFHDHTRLKGDLMDEARRGK